MNANKFLVVCIALLTYAKMHAFDPMNNTGFKLEPTLQNMGNEALEDMYHKNSLVSLISTKDAEGRPKIYQYSNKDCKASHIFEGTSGFEYAMNDFHFVRKPADNNLYIFNTYDNKESNHQLNINATIHQLVLSKFDLGKIYVAHGKGASILQIRTGKELECQDIKHREVKQIIELSYPKCILLMGSDQSITPVDTKTLKMTGLSVFAYKGCANDDGRLLALANINFSNDINIYNSDDLESPIKKMSFAEGYGVYYTYHMSFANNDKWLVCVTQDYGAGIHLFDIAKQHKIFYVQNPEACITRLVIPDSTISPYIALFKSLKGNWTGLLKNESNENK